MLTTTQVFARGLSQKGSLFRLNRRPKSSWRRPPCNSLQLLLTLNMEKVQCPIIVILIGLPSSWPSGPVRDEKTAQPFLVGLFFHLFDFDDLEFDLAARCFRFGYITDFFVDDGAADGRFVRDPAFTWISFRRPNQVISLRIETILLNRDF